MTRDQFNLAEQILIRIARLQNTIESIKYYQKEVKKDSSIDAWMVIHGLDKPYKIQIGANKQDDKVLVKTIKNRIKKLENDFKKL